MEISLQIREVLRGPVDAPIVPNTSDSDAEPFRPVHIPAQSHGFAQPAPTQAVAPPAQEKLEEADELEVEQHIPVAVPEAWSQHVHHNLDEVEAPKPLRFEDMQSPSTFFDVGLGEGGAMILPGALRDRSLMGKLLLLGRSELTLAKAVDIYHVVETKDGKRRKLRPPQGKVLQVLQKAFSLYPRLGQVNATAGRGSDTIVVLRGWTASTTNQLLYHNEAMRCCRVSIREIAKRVSLWQDREAGKAAGEAVGAQGAVLEERQQAAPQPATPPTGRR